MKPEGVGPWPKFVSGASKDPEAATEKQRVSAEHEEVGPQGVQQGVGGLVVVRFQE